MIVYASGKISEPVSETVARRDSREIRLMLEFREGNPADLN